MLGKSSFTTETQSYREINPHFLLLLLLLIPILILILILISIYRVA